MASNVSFEILDLRHFGHRCSAPVLDAEGESVEARLHWDYRASSKLLMQYIDSHMLPGYAALEDPARSPAMPSASTRKPRR
jgi:hypothetical protein